MTEAHPAPEPRSAGLCVVSGSTYPEFAQAVAEDARLAPYIDGISPVERRQFSNGELFVRYGESLRGKDVFVFQTHHNESTYYPHWSINDAIQEQILMVDAAAGASAAHVTAVCPYFGYSRQDKKDDGRVSIAARGVAYQLVEAGAERVISMDLHSAQTQGFTPRHIPFENIYASPVLTQAILKWAADKSPDELAIVAPDSGRTKLNGRYRNWLNRTLTGTSKNPVVELAIIDKERSDDSSQVDAAEMVGSVVGRHCIVIDDMVDTAKTLSATGRMLVRRGAKSVIVAATHGIFSGRAVSYLNRSPFELVIVSDTIPQTKTLARVKNNRLQVEPVTPIFAELVQRIHTDDSVSEMFIDDLDPVKNAGK